MIYLGNIKIKNIKIGSNQIQKITAGINRVWENWVHHTGSLITSSCSYTHGCTSATGADNTVNMPGEIRAVSIRISVTTSMVCSGDVGGVTSGGYAWVVYTDGTSSSKVSAAAGVHNHDPGQHVGERMSSSASATLYPDPNKIVSQLKTHCNYGSGEYCGDGSISATITDWWSRG